VIVLATRRSGQGDPTSRGAQAPSAAGAAERSGEVAECTAAGAEKDQGGLTPCMPKLVGSVASCVSCSNDQAIGAGRVLDHRWQAGTLRGRYLAGVGGEPVGRSLQSDRLAVTAMWMNDGVKHPSQRPEDLVRYFEEAVLPGQ
jgi:hypothetical protein